MIPLSNNLPEPALPGMTRSGIWSRKTAYALFAIGIVVMTGFSPRAQAAKARITLSGTVFGGIDKTGVFGFPPNTDLTGKPFTLSLTFEDSLGTEVFGTTESYIINTSTSNPGTAVLQIGNGSFAFGTSSPSKSEAQLTAYGSSYYILVSSEVNPGFSNYVQGTVYPATDTSLTTNPSWEAPFSDSNLWVSPVPNYRYNLFFQIGGTAAAIANGQLAASTIMVSGPNTVCPVNVSLSSGVVSLPKKLAYMMAEFKAPSPVNTRSPSTIVDYATACGFDSFNWQQQITIDPGGSSGIFVQPNDPQPLIVSGNVTHLGNAVSLADGLCISNWTGCSLVAPPPYFDPPLGGVKGGFNSYPFWYLVYPSTFFDRDGICVLPGSLLCPPYGLPYVVSSDGTTFSFIDTPARSTLPGVAPAKHPSAGSFVAFTTTLVGVSAHPFDPTSKTSGGNASCGVGSSFYCTPLYSWTWNTTFNGTSGGVTITSIDGVPH